VSIHSDTQPSPPPDSEPTMVRQETPIEMLIRDVAILASKVDMLAGKVDSLTTRVTQAIEGRVTDIRQLTSRVEAIECRDHTPICQS
jgi:hypothetical protein